MLQIFQETVMRLQHQVNQQQPLSAKPVAATYSSYAPPKPQQELPFIYIIAAIAMAIFGVIMGKFIL
jgi:hypothetical protein